MSRFSTVERAFLESEVELLTTECLKIGLKPFRYLCILSFLSDLELLSRRNHLSWLLDENSDDDKVDCIASDLDLNIDEDGFEFSSSDDLSSFSLVSSVYDDHERVTYNTYSWLKSEDN